jgi:hypothetical protein
LSPSTVGLLVCGCGDVTFSSTDSKALSIELPPARHGTSLESTFTLEECLNLFFGFDVPLDFVRSACACGRSDGVLKIARLVGAAPDYLVINLLRFTGGGLKRLDVVVCPRYLDLSPYVSDPVDSTWRYELRGACKHVGAGPSEGHWTSIVRATVDVSSEREAWFWCDDLRHGSVCPVTSLCAFMRSEIPGDVAMLLYRKVNL